MIDYKELSVGDWVLVNSLPAQVFEIAYNRNEGEMTVGILDPQGEIYSCFGGYDHVEPIPLTDEILKKNGLSITKFPFCSIYFDEDTNYNLELSENEEGDIYWSISFDEYEIIRLRYVHELQHALRLCDIDKEIEL